jgi:hypothetical protein
MRLLYDKNDVRHAPKHRDERFEWLRQQVIARLEDTSYQGHSFSMLRRIATALGRELRALMARRDSQQQRT